MVYDSYDHSLIPFGATYSVRWFVSPCMQDCLGDLRLTQQVTVVVFFSRCYDFGLAWQLREATQRGNVLPRFTSLLLS